MSFYLSVEIFHGKAGKERYSLADWGASVESTGFLCAAGEYPMPVVDLESYCFGSFCRVTILLNNTGLNVWSSVAEVLQCYCDSTTLPVSLLPANPALSDWSKGSLQRNPLLLYFFQCY